MPNLPRWVAGIGSGPIESRDVIASTQFWRSRMVYAAVKYCAIGEESCRSIDRICAARERTVRMGMVNDQVWDATGAKRQEVQMPDDAPINRILAVLIEKMKFPQYA